MMVNARVKRLVTFAAYSDEAFKELFREAGIQVDILPKPSSEITFME
jgi:dCMP deaminase